MGHPPTFTPPPGVAGPGSAWEAVLLDLDRTLVDVESHVDYCAALADLERAGLHEAGDLGPATSWGGCTRRVVDLLVGLDDRDAWRRAEGLVVPYELEAAERSTAMPGLQELLAVTADRPVGIVTLLSRPATAVVVERHGLSPDVVVARSHDVPAKPHPDQLLVALADLRVPPGRAVMVGDSERDEAAAVAAGVDFVGITNGRTTHRFEARHVVADLRQAAALVAA